MRPIVLERRLRAWSRGPWRTSLRRVPVTAVLAFILLLGPLVVVHELGHLLAAKAVGVHAPRFSIGFGTPLLKKKWGETEYCLAPIPLGGYVLLLGQNPHEEVPEQLRGRSLAQKPLWARYLVIAAGPLTNFILPFIIYFFFYLSQVTTHAAVVGSVVDGYSGDRAGMRAGDVVVAIDDERVDSWRDLSNVISGAADETIQVTVRRDGSELTLEATPDVYTEPTEEANRRGLLGIAGYFHDPQITVIDGSAAQRAGLQTGDIIRSIDGVEVEHIDDLLQRLSASIDSSGPPLQLEVERTSTVQGPLIELDRRQSMDVSLPRTSKYGIHPAQTTLRRVDRDTPASAAGLAVGDRIVAIDGREVRQWEGVLRVFGEHYDAQARVCSPVRLDVAGPDGSLRELEVAEQLLRFDNGAGYMEEVRLLGAYPWSTTHSPDPIQIENRVSWAFRTTHRELRDVIYRMLRVLGRMVTGDGSVDQIAGPIGIGAAAAVAFEEGATQFMFLMALISLNLGIVNLLPIPVLDGGHILFFTLEAVMRRPLGHRAREIASAAGLLVIALLMLLAFRNDITRLFS